MFNDILYCIVLYCIAFVNLYSDAHSSGHSVALPVREPLEKKKVLRWEKAAGRDPKRMVARREEGRAFHREGPKVAKDLVCASGPNSWNKKSRPVQGAERSMRN